MSHDELFQQVERLLQRKLTPDECKFLILASDVLQEKKEPAGEANKAKAQVA